MFSFIGKVVTTALAAVGAYHTVKYVSKRGTDGVKEDAVSAWNDFKSYFADDKEKVKEESK